MTISANAPPRDDISPPMGDTDEATSRSGKTGMRRCIASGAVVPTESLVRFVVGPDSTLVPDIDNRLPGRGLWLSAHRDMVEKAASKRLFAKVARRNVTIPANLADTVAELLRRRCLNHLGLARRAGLVTAGREKVRAQIAAGRVALLLEAVDGSLPERRKLAAMVPRAPVVDLFTSTELGTAVGRDAAVHVALADGRLTRTIFDDAARYRGFRRTPASE